VRRRFTGLPSFPKGVRPPEVHFANSSNMSQAGSLNVGQGNHHFKNLGSFRNLFVAAAG
jgi:hypothetical protein